MNELTRQEADSGVIEGEFRDAGSPPPVERVVTRGYATLPPRPSPPPMPPSTGGRYVYPKRKTISPYMPDWAVYMTIVGFALVAWWFFSMLHAEQAITGP